MSVWTDILTPEQIDAYHKLTATLDAGFALADRDFMNSRTPEQHDALATGCWHCNDGERYQLHRSYAAMKRA